MSASLNKTFFSLSLITDLRHPNTRNYIGCCVSIKRYVYQHFDQKYITNSQVPFDWRNPLKGSSSEEPFPSKPSVGKDNKMESTDSCSGRLNKVEKRLIPTNNSYKTFRRLS